MREKLKASVTVEAACIFPIFLFSVLAFYYMLVMFGIQNRIDSALADTANEASLYGYYYEKDFIWEAAFFTNLDKYVMKNPCIRFHLISLSGSSYQGDDIYLKVKYGFILPVPFFHSRTIWKETTIHTRKYVGWDRRQDGNRSSGGAEDNDTYVYITETGSVYHKSLDCTHLSLSVRTVDADQVSSLRNEGGARYYSCEKCGKGKVLTGEIFITDEGNRYHFSRQCSGLKRSIEKIRLSEVNGRKCCSRCGK